MIFILKGLCSSKLHVNSFSTFPTHQNSKSISIYNYNMDILAEHRLSQQTMDVHLKSWMLQFAAALSFSCLAQLRIISVNSFYKGKQKKLMWVGLLSRLASIENAGKKPHPPGAFYCQQNKKKIRSNFVPKSALDVVLISHGVISVETGGKFFKLGVDFRKTVLPAVILIFFSGPPTSPNF